MTDPRPRICLERARASAGHVRQCYAALALGYARQSGDEVSAKEAIALGALEYRRAPLIYAKTETAVIQLTFFEEAA